MKKNMNDIKPGSQLIIYQNPDVSKIKDIYATEPHSYRYKPPRALEDIAADVEALEGEIVAMPAEITGSAEGGK